MTDRRRLFGDSSEELAVQCLRESGYKVLERNVRFKVGEIDVVAEDSETLVFVEVRARTDPEQIHPAATVTRRKQLQIIRAAMTYLQERGIRDRMVRFDVVAVLGPLGECELLQNAFEAGR